jgi:hypothetical protein
VKREELSHLLRAACTIVDDSEILVIGSQSILGSHHEDDLPERALLSMEADLAFLDDDADASKALDVEGVLGEFSPFHIMNSYYAQGVSVSTAQLPAGWQDRVVQYDMRSADPAKAVCLEPHDLVISKLIAYRDKDREFAMALLQARLIDVDVLRERVKDVPTAHPVARRAAQQWIEGAARRLQ